MRRLGMPLITSIFAACLSAGCPKPAPNATLPPTEGASQRDGDGDTATSETGGSASNGNVPPNSSGTGSDQTAPGLPPIPPAGQDASARAVAWLAHVQDRFHRSFDIYTDPDAPGNHFSARGRLSSPGDEDGVPAMNEQWTIAPQAGFGSIRAAFHSRGANWGGWYFLNGVLRGSETSPRPNWGDEVDAGVNLAALGATRLTFWARGEDGGERVEFFAFGVGRNPQTGDPIMPRPDSAPKRSLGFVTLSQSWRMYSIPLNGLDLGYVLGGFGWVTSAAENSGRDVVFYVDSLSYETAPRTDPRFLLSYKTVVGTDFDRVMRNVAFTYDNAVAAIAFLAAGHPERAKLIVDAFVYTQDHDRYFTDGRLRNAYEAGDLVLPPGWTPNGRTGTVRMPGWYDSPSGAWLEDRFQVSTHTGNVAWAMLALLAYYESQGGDEYFAAAVRLGDWIEANCRDARGAGGYTAGFDGWEPSPQKLLYKSTEHAIDCLAAFERLHALTRDERWGARADHAKRFVLAMWDSADGKFWTGTTEDGVTINTSVIPVDVQAWSVLVLRDPAYFGALAYADAHLRTTETGFDFNQDRDGVWLEGTAQMAVAFHLAGQSDRADRIVLSLSDAANADGAMPAASRDGLTTGFVLSDGTPWLYFQRAHVGATAWFALAAYNNVNPFEPLHP